MSEQTRATLKTYFETGDRPTQANFEDVFDSIYTPTELATDGVLDTRYYTETEVDALLAGKSDTGHAHAAADITSGTLAVARGGTGLGALGAARQLLQVNAAGSAAEWTSDLSITSAAVSGRITGGWLKDGYVGMPGLGAYDMSMGGLYDRNILAIADKKGTVTFTITGPGSVANVQNMFDATGSYGAITGTDNTTTQIVIHIDLFSLQPHFGSVQWQPFVHYRFDMNTLATYYRDILVEVSADNASWHTYPAGWATTTAEIPQQVPGLWMGTLGNPNSPSSLPGNQFRYVRFTLTDRWETPGYGLRDAVWISQIGLRHHSAPFASQFLRADGSSMYGALSFVPTGGTTARTTINRDGSAIFDTNVLVVDQVNDRVGMGTTTPGAQLHALLSNATTAAVDTMSIFAHDSTGTPAAGFGGALAMRLKSSTTTGQNAARLAWRWNVATHASRSADLVAYASDHAAERELWRGRANGTAAALGFYGATPVTRPNVTGSRAGGAALQNLLTALGNLGLITDSTTA